MANPENIGSVVSSNNVPLNLNVQTTLDAYEQAIQNAFGLTIEEINHSLSQDSEGEVMEPSISLSPLPPIDYTVLNNYHTGLEALADLYDDVLLDAGLDVANQYQLYQQIMGQMTVIRTNDRNHIDCPNDSNCTGTAYGYNAGDTFYDIFDDPDGDDINDPRTTPMSPLNFTHELLHTFHSYANLGSDSNHFLGGYLNSTLATMTAVDNVEGVLEDAGLVVRQNGGGTFRQSPDIASHEEMMVDAMMYAAYDLFNYLGTGNNPTLTASNAVERDLYDLMASGIRNAIVHNLPREDQIDLFQEHGYLPQDYGTVVGEISDIQLPPNIRTSSNTASRNNIIDGITIDNDEIYSIFGSAIDPSRGYNFIAFYRNGRIVWVVDSEFDWSESSEGFSNGQAVPQVNDFDNNFDPSVSLSETSWWIGLVSD